MKIFHTNRCIITWQSKNIIKTVLTIQLITENLKVNNNISDSKQNANKILIKCHI